ncbi:MAG TPA: amidohydrolase family protein [Jatrophihabitans sp.]|nr:amidohydrolase family protein [Jatrophihabitans sp.]
MSVAADLPLLDQHCHGVMHEAFARRDFESLLTEADAPGPWHGSLFDTQVGFAVRSMCAPVLDLPPGADPETYLARRAELGGPEVARRLFAELGITAFCVDTGLLPDRVTPPDELAQLAGGAARGVTAHEVTRLEHVAEQVMCESEPGAFADELRGRLERCAKTSVGFKSIAAYRGGLDLDPARPDDAEVRAAVERWRRDIDAERRVRCADPVLQRFLIWSAVDLGLPLQFHVGYGDPDVDLHRCDPLLLTPLLRATAGTGARVMLLHNYPFQRHAGYLAQVFDHVFVDVGLALHNVGARASVVLAELLELAPFGSVLFSSDAFGLAELYYVAVTRFRDALGDVLDDGLRRQEWSAGEAERIAMMICEGNARRAYGLARP